MLYKYEWDEGINIGRVLDVEDTKTDNFKLYRVRLANIYYNYLPLVYVVPEWGKEHQIIKDLLFFYRKEDKPWIKIKLKKDDRLNYVITSLEEIHDISFQEMEVISTRLRRQFAESNLGSRARLISI